MLLRVLGILCFGLLFFGCTDKNTSIPNKPNIIIIFTDDQGYADVGAYGVLDDIKTPYIDQLAADGVRMTAGYVTAPQCSPSRAGILSGIYQQKIGFENNTDGPMDGSIETIAERLQKVGYKTGMVGKWHLEPNIMSQNWIDKNLPESKGQRPKSIPHNMKKPYLPFAQGFEDVWWGNREHYQTTFSLKGDSYSHPKNIINKKFRIDVQSDASIAFIEKNKEEPFFLYLPYFAPHVPLEANQKYLNRFPKKMPNRRKHALAMISAMDDGVGRIVAKLKEHNLYENTILFFVSDNGAPLDLTMDDKPDIHLASGTWDGSINDPWVGEKGMLSEGGIRVPYIVTWPNTLPSSQTYNAPVNTLDVTATSLSVAGADDSRMDGINLIPYLTQEIKKTPDRNLYWRFWNQAAVRNDRWKYLYLSSGDEYLFDMKSAKHEKINLVEKKPKIANRLKSDLKNWTQSLPEKGLPADKLNNQEIRWYNHFFDANL